MIPAKLMKDLERIGFSLDFPSYESNEKRIIAIIKQKNERLLLALPLLFIEGIDYIKIKKRLSPTELKKLNKAIIITNQILEKEKEDNAQIQKLIKINNIKAKPNKYEFNYHYDTFKDSISNKNEQDEEEKIDNIRLRGKLNLNQSLSIIYAPAKIRIMNKIFNHEQLTNTELKYYYKAIRPLNLSILNENMQQFLRLIESTKKYPTPCNYPT